MFLRNNDNTFYIKHFLGLFLSFVDWYWWHRWPLLFQLSIR